MVNRTAIKILTDKDLRITPQRVAVLDVILNLDTHPSAETIAEFVRINYPHVPLGTIYKILDIFVEKEIISRVKTEDGIIRYDPIMEKHHHLYCAESERIEDYYDEDLNKILNDYFKKKKIPDFTIVDFKVQITGKFRDENKTNK